MTRVPPASPAPAGRPFYFAVWRWHFYAGLYVAPFVMVLAVTGLIMLWTGTLAGPQGEHMRIAPGREAAAPWQLADAAAAAVPGGQLRAYLSPGEAGRVAVFRVDGPDGAPHAVLIDPYRAEVVGQRAWGGGLFALANAVHGTLLLGRTGDVLIEIAASLGMVLIATGAVLWWPRGPGGLARALLPDLRASGRRFWRSLHGALGAWLALGLAAFLVTGLSWTGIWGERLVQAWSTFPAGKWGVDMPLSHKTHASLNVGAEKTVPWAIEQTPLPASTPDPHAGHHGAAAAGQGDLRFVAGSMPGMVMAPAFDQLVAEAEAQGFRGRYQIAFPQGETGVWSITHDSQSHDGPDPTGDRTIHVDRYDGRVLADFGYADYSAGGRLMAFAIAFHQGDMGWWNIALNTALCLGVIALGLSGLVLWWLRRPAGQARLAAPPRPAGGAGWRVAALVALVPAVLFPLGGLVIAAVLLADWLVIARLPGLRRVVS